MHTALFLPRFPSFWLVFVDYQSSLYPPASWLLTVCLPGCHYFQARLIFSVKNAIVWNLLQLAARTVLSNCQWQSLTRNHILLLSCNTFLNLVVYSIYLYGRVRANCKHDNIVSTVVSRNSRNKFKQYDSWRCTVYVILFGIFLVSLVLFAGQTIHTARIAPANPSSTFFSYFSYVTWQLSHLFFWESGMWAFSALGCDTV